MVVCEVIFVFVNCGLIEFCFWFWLFVCKLDYGILISVIVVIVWYLFNEFGGV